MTNETEFGTYTRNEVEELVERAVDEERGNRFAALMVWMFIGFATGVIVGAVTL